MGNVDRAKRKRRGEWGGVESSDPPPPRATELSQTPAGVRLERLEPLPTPPLQDREIVLAAVSSSKYALQWGSKEIRGDREVLTK